MNVWQRIGVGVQAWYLAWFVEGAAERIGPTIPVDGRAALPAPQPAAMPPQTPAPVVQKPSPPPQPKRSEALTLLETLQREARLIDFLKEEIGPYEDAQIGAAVRDIHRDAAKALERLFALRPVLDQSEGDAVTLGERSAGQVRLVGNVREGATAGTLVHHGWIATKTELPLWNGAKDAAHIIAPAEVEVT